MARRPVERPSGAVQSKSRPGDRLDAWFAHHSTSAIDSLLRLLQHPGQSLMTWLVVAIALVLPAALFVVLLNLQQLATHWESSNQLSVFLQPDITDSQAQQLRDTWASRPDVRTVSYLSPDQALVEFREFSGLGRLLDSLEQNPLTGVLLVQPGQLTLTELDTLQAYLADEPGVDEVRMDMQWVQRLEQLMALAERLVMALAGLLALGLVLIIGNTLRLAIENRRDEILVVKLVGGTDAYVRRPFLYTGLWYGLGGGLLAALLLAFGLAWLGEPAGLLADLYHSQFRLRGLGFIGSLQLILAGGLLGLLGAWLAVGRHLRLLQPH